MSQAINYKFAEANISESEPIHLLWTGGWDSTFRLLQIIFEEGKKVQPYYVISPQECTGKEIDTINIIRRKLFRDHPYLKEFILPVKFTDVFDIEADFEITDQFKKIAKKKHINVQYEILARYCKQIDISVMELSVLSSEKFNSYKSGTKIFKYFEYPLLGFTKLEMERTARLNSWMRYMELTWFCRRPKNNRPCGFCGPCTDVILEGMGWRLPLRSRVIAFTQLPFRKWWRRNYLKQEVGINKKIKKILKNRA